MLSICSHTWIENRKPATRDIVPSTCVKSFNFSDYKKDGNIYKNKLLKIRLHPDRKKEKCNVLYAAADQHKVVKKSKEKRFAPCIPEFCDTISEVDTSFNITGDGIVTGTPEDEDPLTGIEDEDPLAGTEDTQETDDVDNTEMVAKAQKIRKRKSEALRKNKEANNDMLLDAYLQNLNDNEDGTDGLNSHHTSTPIRNGKNKTSKSNPSDAVTIRQQEIRIKHLEGQLKRCRKEIGQINQDHEEGLNQNENQNTINTSDIACCGTDQFKVHDKMFGFSKEQAEQELEYNEEGNDHLRSQVYCNPVAFNDAYKSKKPFNCLCLLSEGVYGLDELSKRCEQKQTNIRDCKVLSPTKRLVIERKVYAFMRMEDQTLSQIYDFLDNLNGHHRKAINGAIARL